MSRFEHWILTLIARHLVRQGYNHKARIIRYYRIMWLAIQHEFCEDNKATHEAFALECFQDAKHAGGE